MSKKEIKSEKTFWEKHGFKIVTGLAATGALICLVKCIRKPDDEMDVAFKRICKVFENANETHAKNGMSLYTGWTDGIECEKLGELGEKIMELGAKHDTKYTHYILIGERIVE